MDYSLLERISASPGAFFVSCLVWIPVFIWVYAMVAWMVMGEIEVPMGLLGLAVALMLGYFTVNPPHPGLSVPMFIAIVLSTIFFPVARSMIHQHMHVMIDVEQVQKAYDALRLRPDNIGAMIKLSEALYNRGMVGPAVGIMDKALTGQPKSVFANEIRMVNAWKMQLTDPRMARPLPCMRCNTVNDLDQTFCKRCKSPYLLDHASGKWAGSNLGQRIIAVWILMVMIVASIPATATALVPQAAIPLIVLQIGLAIFVAIRAFREGSTFSTA